MATLASLQHLILPWAQSAPVPAVEHALRGSVREFCRRTHALQQWLAPITMTAGDATLTLPVPVGYEILTALVARADGHNITPKSAQWLDEHSPYEDWRSIPPNTIAYFVSDFARPESLLSVPAPAANTVVKVKVALRPTGAFSTIDDTLLRWDETLAWGAIERLYSMPSMAWTNVERAGEMRGKFLSGAAIAASEVRRSGVDAPMQVEMRPMA